MARWVFGLATMGAALLATRTSEAFCGFYVAGADAKLFNDATQVVLMRDGTRTILSMQNHYKGPPSGFAMVVPVPVVLQKENVKTLPMTIFDRVDQLTAPRLVEYWEQDPCRPPIQYYPSSAPQNATGGAAIPTTTAAPPTVKIEAQFTVGEYEIVILSASDSTGLDDWLHQNGYAIPNGAEPYLRPYVQMGMKFFVAKVDPTKVTFSNGQAQLSPLRFHYDSDQFSLPIRLGLINASGSQDLIVTILALGKRYEVTNYENVTIPTNLEVAEAARGQFAAFYTSLFDRTLAKHPKAVATEYSWQATSCDPCPVDPLSDDELATLGGDVIPSAPAPSGPSNGYWSAESQFVVTRLHARYDATSLGEDLFFREAPAIFGGREVPDQNGKLEQGAQQSNDVNNYQSRYIIRHPWRGAIACANPQRGVWGDDPNASGSGPSISPAQKLGLAPRGGPQLASLVSGTIPPENVLSAASATPVMTVAPTPTAPPSASPPDAGATSSVDASPATQSTPTTGAPRSGCAACDIGGAGGGAGLAFVTAALLGGALAARRRARD
jgi:hypothetical protein